jgi:Helix-turn-helix domain
LTPLQDVIHDQVRDGSMRFRIKNDPKILARIEVMHQAGVSFAEIGRAFGVHSSWISRLVRKPEEKPRTKPTHFNGSLGVPEYRGRMAEPKFEGLLIAGWVSNGLMTEADARELIQISRAQSVQLDLLVAENVLTEEEASAARDFRAQCLQWFETWLTTSQGPRDTTMRNRV